MGRTAGSKNKSKDEDEVEVAMPIKPLPPEPKSIKKEVSNDYEKHAKFSKFKQGSK